MSLSPMVDPSPAPTNAPSSLDAVPAAVEDLARTIARVGCADVAAYGRKRGLQSLVGGAYAELCREGMESDRADFAKETRELRRRIRAERGKIAELLRIPLEEDSGSDGDDCDGGGDRPTAAPAEAAAAVAGDGGESTTGDSGDPFMESILLLRRETPKLETVVAKLLLRCGDHSSSSSSSSSSTAAEDARGALIFGGKAGDDPPSSIVDVACDRQPGGGSSASGEGGGGYRLASRIVQEGGEEIKIFEKCTTGAE